MNCPYCRETIDDDSIYCDQCGGEILLCSLCGRPGKGKRCIFDGQVMIKPGHEVNTGTETIPVQQMSAVSSGTTDHGDKSKQLQPFKLRLYSKTHGIDITPSHGDVIGRKSGPFAEIFSRFPQVSGSHIKIEYNDSIWTVSDTGSTNGTYINKVKLVPNKAGTVNNGSTLRIADIDFSVEIAVSENATARI